jgi:hypothetical protein
MKQLEAEIQSMKDEQSNGVDQMFPFGPTCTFIGVEVPTFVTCSKNGSITSQLLTNMLQTMDKLSLLTSVMTLVLVSSVMAMAADSKNHF